MRLAVLEASKRLEEEQQRRAREELRMRKEQARSNMGAGRTRLIMRHGGELSADAIKQFVQQQQKEEQRKVQEASKRSGRRHQRNRTSSDIRGMFGSGNDLNNLTLPKQGAESPTGGIPDFHKPCSPKRKTLTPTLTKPTMVPNTDLPELPELRGATKPGHFRKTNYDPFSFGVTKDENNGADKSLQRNIDL